jgi:hypothetical protein
MNESRMAVASSRMFHRDAIPAPAPPLPNVHEEPLGPGLEVYRLNSQRDREVRLSPSPGA